MSWRDKVATGEILTEQEKADLLRETGIKAGPGAFRFKVELSAVVRSPDGSKRDLGIIGSTENGTITRAPAAPAGA